MCGLVFRSWQREKSNDLSKNTTPATPVSKAIDIAIVRLNEHEIEKKKNDASLMFALPASRETPLLLYKILIQYRNYHFDERMKFKISGQERIIEGVNIYDLTLHVSRNCV